MIHTTTCCSQRMALYLLWLLNSLKYPFLLLVEKLIPAFSTRFNLLCCRCVCVDLASLLWFFLLGQWWMKRKRKWRRKAFRHLNKWLRSSEMKERADRWHTMHVNWPKWRSNGSFSTNTKTTFTPFTLFCALSSSSSYRTTVLAALNHLAHRNISEMWWVYSWDRDRDLKQSVAQYCEALYSPQSRF